MSDDITARDADLEVEEAVPDDLRELAEFIDDRLLVHLEVMWQEVLARSPTAAELWDLAMDIATDLDYDYEFRRLDRGVEPDDHERPDNDPQL